MGGNADGDSSLSEGLDLGQVHGDRRLSHPLEAAPCVRDVEAGEADARLGGGVGRCERGLQPEVVELADGGVPGRPHLAVRPGVQLAHRRRRQAVGLLEHAVSPRPEVASGGASAEASLERVTVGVDEAGKRSRSRHGRRH